MEKSMFTRLLAMANTLAKNSSRATYWAGYILGLRRAYHGRRFGTQEEHTRRWKLTGDPTRRQMSAGYRDGYLARQPSETRVLSTQGAADRLGVSRSWIRHLILDGRLPAEKPSPRVILIREADLDLIK